MYPSTYCDSDENSSSWSILFHFGPVADSVELWAYIIDINYYDVHNWWPWTVEGSNAISIFNCPHL